MLLPLQGAVPCCPFPRALPWAREVLPLRGVCLPARPHSPSPPPRGLTRASRFTRDACRLTRAEGSLHAALLPYPRRMSPYTSRRLLTRAIGALHATNVALHEPKAPSPPPRGLTRDERRFTRASRLTRAIGALHATHVALHEPKAPSPLPYSVE